MCGIEIPEEITFTEVRLLLRRTEVLEATVREGATDTEVLLLWRKTEVSEATVCGGATDTEVLLLVHKTEVVEATERDTRASCEERDEVPEDAEGGPREGGEPPSMSHPLRERPPFWKLPG